MSDMQEKIKAAILDGAAHANEINATLRDGMVIPADPLAHAAGSVVSLIKAEFRQSPEAFARWAAQ